MPAGLDDLAEEAVRLAEEACALTGLTAPEMIATLAAAYAETDKIPQAIKASKATFVIWTSKTHLGSGVPREIRIGRRSKVPDILLLEEGVDAPDEYKGSDSEWTRFSRNNAPALFAKVIRSYREMDGT